MLFKDILGSASKIVTSKTFIFVVIIAVIGYMLLNYSDSKSFVQDSMTDGSAPTVTTAPAKPVLQNVVQPAASTGGYAAQASVNPSDLLPQDQNSQWAALNPVNQGNIAAPDLLQAGYHIGLDTIGQTLRNASYDLRSDPIIPKTDVGPWNQSTIEADLGRVSLEVGSGGR